MKTYGLVGFPLSHSFSAGYFEEKFDLEKISDTEYKLFPLKNINEFTRLVKNNPSLCGLNVTIPYKEAIIPLLDEMDDQAREAGAVNCIAISRKASNLHHTKGYNTDITGFEKSIRKHLKPHHAKALILGTGGAAKAVHYVLLKMNIPHHFVSRSVAHGKTWLRNSAPLSKLVLSYSELDKTIISNHLLIINATPEGMYPEMGASPPLPYEFVTGNHLLFDLVYNPAETIFLQKGREKKSATVNGLEMLYIQADESWKIWNK